MPITRKRTRDRIENNESLAQIQERETEEYPSLCCELKSLFLCDYSTKKSKRPKYNNIHLGYLMKELVHLICLYLKPNSDKPFFELYKLKNLNIHYIAGEVENGDLVCDVLFNYDYENQYASINDNDKKIEFKPIVEGELVNTYFMRTFKDENNTISREYFLRYMDPDSFYRVYSEKHKIIITYNLISGIEFKRRLCSPFSKFVYGRDITNRTIIQYLEPSYDRTKNNLTENQTLILNKVFTSANARPKFLGILEDGIEFVCGISFEKPKWEHILEMYFFPSLEKRVIRLPKFILPIRHIYFTDYIFAVDDCCQNVWLINIQSGMFQLVSTITSHKVKIQTLYGYQAYYSHSKKKIFMTSGRFFKNSELLVFNVPDFVYEKK